jgi:transposase
VLIAELRALHRLQNKTLQHLHRLLRQMRASHPDPQRPSDVEIIDSLPGAGTLTVAAVFAEASQAVADRRGDTLRTYAGLAPVTRQSGKYRSVSIRYACYQRLRDAFRHFTLAVCATRLRVAIMTNCAARATLRPVRCAVWGTAG